ncbi:ubiquitin carboxyl-terminal hydrolase 44-B-like [Physella acuta]|uniref:ubiquitin carboxyl-terminal hydrolase 44-B-like n=1 Tax=Physella acuta TaxID=109671 RepID=UPI0027DC44B0|nr:ubiquitin carboxyl-terminal hydrolase 44-B-like [Physella acuta]XP_059179642.1 ubiquitin carboxyl-terminal hydrolase 44-B-like [Physella acuta]XP_059179643.1 ubiquitin carboxyl-terminal hydrolase 44-B-like [Physella acuta]XP_059179644.1 ubiquitin carboxyl-terminal hydrolase 44-B-like [Physella acuta]
MEKCPHVETLVVSNIDSILDPTRWQCSVCGTTETVWACLSCSNVACGRQNEQHAEKHFQTTQHPLAIEINEKYVYCYICDEYIIGNLENGDIETIRTALTDIGTMSPQEALDKGGKLLQSYTHQQEISRTNADEDDRYITAECHHRKALLSRVLSAWQTYVQNEKEQKIKKSQTSSGQPPMLTRARSSLFHVKRRTLIPGVTGLRNLGNTCYINSILQSLGHLEDFREYFCQLVFGLFSPSGTPVPGSSPSSLSPLSLRNVRLNTVDYFQHLNYRPSTQLSSSIKSSASDPSKKGGLNGGGSSASAEPLDEAPIEPMEQVKSEALETLSLCQEMHGLLRVLWSGKWAQVSPHGFLHAVWKAIPAFKGHLQHDAQEFLCELLDKVSQEIENLPQCNGVENIVDQSFRGEIISQVTCMSCTNVSSRHEPFLDLSLEFPRCFQYTASQVKRNMCHLTEMLSTFTDVEELEPLSYICEKCNQRRRRPASRQPIVRTNAKKQLLISRPPEILRLHLKRFRWCGRNHREKIGTHVAFDEELDISPFCQGKPEVAKYKLNAVVVHHGAGFRAGHYTAYTFNSYAESWLHCNDARVQLVPLTEVLGSQAYILFYTRQLTTVNLEDMPALIGKSGEPDTLSTLSTIPELDQEMMETLRQLTPGQTVQAIDDEVSISFHRDPVLVKRLSSPRTDHKNKRTSSTPTDEEPPPPKTVRHMENL